jgi:type I restriction enzyme S subunit
MNQLVRLGELGEWGSGGTPLVSRSEFYGGEIPWLIIEDLNDGLVERSSRSITKLGLDNSSAKVVPVGTLLIAMYGSIGKLGIAGIDCATNQAIAFCKSNPAKVDPRYLFYLLRYHRTEFIHAGRGGTQQNISQEFLKNYEVALPELAEQCQIATLLKTAEHYKLQRRVALDLSEALIPSTFIEWFGQTDPSWLNLTVDDLAEERPNAIRTGPFGSQLLHSEFVGSGVAVLGIDNAVANRFEWAERRYITMEKFKQLGRYQVHPGDVLITIMATCGRCAIVPSDIGLAINTKHLCCITPDQSRCLPEYLHGVFLYHPSVRSQLEIATRGSIMDGLNMQIIRGLRIPIPPVSAQRRYVDFLAAADGLLRVHREGFNQATSLFEGLLEICFSPTLGLEVETLDHAARHSVLTKSDVERDESITFSGGGA